MNRFKRIACCVLLISLCIAFAFNATTQEARTKKEVVRDIFKKEPGVALNAMFSAINGMEGFTAQEKNTIKSTLLNAVLNASQSYKNNLISREKIEDFQIFGDIGDASSIADLKELLSPAIIPEVTE